jgi:hypothetical protein
MAPGFESERRELLVPDKIKEAKQKFLFQKKQKMLL